MARARTTRAARAATARAKRPKRHFLVQFTYTAEAWRRMVTDEKLRDRVALLRHLIELYGGCFLTITFECDDERPPDPEGDDGDDDDEDHAYYRGIRPMEKLVGFGPDFQVVTILAFPHYSAASAFAIAVCQSGMVTNFRMTPLLPWGVAMKVMARVKKTRDAKAFPAGWA
jgi:hypothetical protein